MSKKFTTKDAEAVFQKLALDERLPHVLSDWCEERREAMIGIMLDELHVPYSAIGRIIVQPQRGYDMIMPRPYKIIGQKRYQDGSWVEKCNKLEKLLSSDYLPPAEDWSNYRDEVKAFMEDHIAIMHHTAVIVRCYDPHSRKEIDMVVDPHLNPTQMMTIGKFESLFKERNPDMNLTVECAMLGEPQRYALRGSFLIDWSNHSIIKEEKIND